MLFWYVSIVQYDTKNLDFFIFCAYLHIYTQEYEINPAIDNCAKAQSTISFNNECLNYRSFTTVVAIQQSGFFGVALEQLDESVKTLCRESCGKAVNNFYTTFQANRVSYLFLMLCTKWSSQHCIRNYLWPILAKRDLCAYNYMVTTGISLAVSFYNAVF